MSQKTSQGKVLTVRGSLLLALGLWGGTPILRHWNTHTQKSHHCTLDVSWGVFVADATSCCHPYLYIRRYFPSRPLSERETSKEQDTGIPLLCLFTSPAGGAQDSRAARACTLDTWNRHINIYTVCYIYAMKPNMVTHAQNVSMWLSDTQNNEFNTSLFVRPFYYFLF